MQKSNRMSKSKSTKSPQSDKNNNNDNDEDYYLKDHYDNVLLVRDNILKKDIEIFIKGGPLHCDHHNEVMGFGCKHMNFVHSLDEVEKLKRAGKLR
jgi:hypothetical protein